jgi:alkanesulfonate monooxygenase SsuD/methylene tetrahydromethanopterin reductase-like flavin-dependent oxidoreductase (luciferase family)
MGLDIGIVILPADPWPELARAFAWAETSGFRTVYTYDHLSWGPMAGEPWQGAVALLGAASQVTKSIRLGTLVASPNFRHPVSLAREVMTLDDVSAGRLDLGIGAGSAGPDASILGQDPWDPEERAARFEEFVALLDALLRGEATDADGRYYRARGAVMAPGCIQRPRVPFTIAASGPRALRTAARFGARWVTLGQAGPSAREAVSVLEAVRRQIDRVEEACAEIDRDPADLERVLLVTDTTPPASLAAFDDLAGPFEAWGFQEIVLHYPAQSGPYRGDLSVFEAIAERYSKH